MASDLHIERADGEPIPLAAWRAAVGATEGVRSSAATAHTITNPQTGEVITIGAREDDAEVFFPEAGEWRPVFRWRGTSAAFAARLSPGERTSPAWRAAVALAAHLRAMIVDDDGEPCGLAPSG